MVTLYLWVRTLLPLLAFVIAWMLLSRLIQARVARLPRVPLNLPEHSSSPRRKDRRIYARKLRRKPGLRNATRPATAPRSWIPAAVFVSLCVLIAAVLAVPDGARFRSWSRASPATQPRLLKYMFPLPVSPSCCRRGSPHWRSCHGR